MVSLKRQVWDLEAVLKVKDEVISARTAAVGLASVAPASPPRATRPRWTSWRTGGREEVRPALILFFFSIESDY